MARKMAAGELETAWFERHRSTPITELPAHWPDDYRALVERRIELIESDRFIGLVERPEYKRRWALEPWEKMEEEALRRWLLDRLEDQHYWSGEPALTSTNRLADLARSDADFMQVAEVYTGRPDFDVAALVRELVLGESVPFLPVLRYNESGLRKRAEWERTWELQRQEDAIDARTELPEGDPGRLTPNQAKALKAKEVGDIPVPPKYKGADFQKTDYWRLRGGLDVPKERFVSYPVLRARGGRQPGRELGRLRPPPAGAGDRPLLPRAQGARGLVARAPPAAARRAARAAALAPAVAQRVRPRDGRAHGRLLRRVRARRGAGARLQRGRARRLDAAREAAVARGRRREGGRRMMTSACCSRT